MDVWFGNPFFPVSQLKSLRKLYLFQTAARPPGKIAIMTCFVTSRLPRHEHFLLPISRTFSPITVSVPVSRRSRNT
jgi:hypothetical protein